MPVEKRLVRQWPDVSAERLASVALVVVLGAIWLQLPLGRPGVPVEETADSTADWLVTRAAQQGGDPYADIRGLADEFGERYVFLGAEGVQDFLGAPPYVHPRSPGALILQLPLLYLDPKGAHLAMGMATIAALATLVLATAHLGNLDRRLTLVLVPALFISSVVGGALAFGVQSVVVAACVSVAWLLLRRSDSVGAGALLGFAITLKLFPALLCVVLAAHKRWRALAVSLSMPVLLNLAGMLVFRLSPREVLDGLGEATRVWLPFGANGSVSRLVELAGVPVPMAAASAPVLALLGVLLVLRRQPSFDAALAAGIILAVLGSPLSWGHYDALLLPVAGWLFGRGGASRWYVGAWFILFLNPFGGTTRADLVGSLLLISRAALLAGVGRAVFAARSTVDAA